MLERLRDSFACIVLSHTVLGYPSVKFSPPTAIQKVFGIVCVAPLLAQHFSAGIYHAGL